MQRSLCSLLPFVALKAQPGSIQTCISLSCVAGVLSCFTCQEPIHSSLLLLFGCLISYSLAALQLGNIWEQTAVYDYIQYWHILKMKQRQFAHTILLNIISIPITEQFKTFNLMLRSPSSQHAAETEESFLILFAQKP